MAIEQSLHDDPSSPIYIDPDTSSTIDSSSSTIDSSSSKIDSSSSKIDSSSSSTIDSASSSMTTLPIDSSVQPVVQIIQPSTKSSSPVTECHLRFRQLDGSSLTAMFPSDTTLFIVQKWVDQHRTDGTAPYALTTTFPTRVFGGTTLGMSLEELDLCPRALLVLRPL